VGSLKKIKWGFGLILIQFLFHFGCGDGKFKGGSLIPFLDSDSFEVINKDLRLPDEFFFEGISPVESADFRELKGYWGKEYMRWNFTPQNYPRIDDGAIEMTMNYLPPQRFKLNFLFRSNGSSSFTTEVFSNVIRIYKQSNGMSAKILELPLRFVPEKNVLRLFFYEDLLALSFNNKEIFRLRESQAAGSGYFNSISINSAGNLGTRTHIKYFSFNGDKDKKQHRKVFNVLSSFDVDSSVEEYIRQVRIGDLTMPAVLAPSPSRIVIPISVPEFADLRFSTATLPVSKAGGAVVRYKVDFLEKGTEKPAGLFDDTELPVNIFDQKWTSCRVDLKDYKGKKGDLIFSAEVKGKGGAIKDGVIALWGAPRILITPKHADTRNVILITVENFGQESLELKANTKTLTPSIHNWIADSVVFKNGYPTTKWVSASLFSMLHGDSEASDEYVSWAKDSFRPLDKFGYSLARVFSENGYDTAAFMQGVACQPFLGLSDGYNEYCNGNKFHDSEADISNSDKLAARASLWVEQRINKNCFLHIHFNTLSELDIESLVKNIKDSRNLQWEFWRRYGDALSRLDGNVGKLLRSLWKVGALKSAVIIIAGTDGINIPSAQGIPRETAIGKDQFLRVPVIFNIQSKFPPTGERKSPIFLSDLYSTILEYMGMKYSARGDSKSFLKSIESDEESPEESRLTVTRLSEPMNPAAGYSLHDSRYKALLVGEDENKPFSLFFFDLKSDPYERSPLSKEMIKNANMSSELDSRVKGLMDKKPSMAGKQIIEHYVKLINQSFAAGQ
jgi:arylsulfatase A-like enzyme